MSTFLDLCKKVHKLGQVQGAFTSVSESGINGEIAAIVSQSWVDIQQLRTDFEFMRKTLSFVAQDGVSLHTLATLFPVTDDFSRWMTETESAFITDSVSGYTSELLYRDYAWIQRLLRNYNVPDQLPTHWSFDPATLDLYLYPKADKVYNATINYYRSAQILVDNANVPHIRPDWHDIIAMKSLSTFGLHKGLGSLHSKYEMEYARKVGELFRHFVPYRTIAITPAC